MVRERSSICWSMFIFLHAASCPLANKVRRSQYIISRWSSHSCVHGVKAQILTITYELITNTANRLKDLETADMRMAKSQTGCVILYSLVLVPPGVYIMLPK